MLQYILRRIFHSIIVVFAISIILFFSIRLTGDPVSVMFSAGEPTKEAVETLKKELGLNEPLFVQYGIFMKDLVTFNLGESFRTGLPVTQMIGERLGATTMLAFGGLIVSVLIAFPIGIFSAIKRGTPVDFFGRIFSLVGISFPNFWLGIMFIIIFAVNLKWLPASGYGSFKHLILPSFTLGLILSGILARLVRSSMLEVLSQQYIATARSKGLKEWIVVLRHAFRNALIPTVTFLGIQFGSLLGGAVIIEQVFSWPGVGRMIIDAINQRDYPVIQGGVIVLALLMVLINLIVDISYSYLDPRIKIGGSEK
ncbi:nickel ABC transporter permease [Siminovitchia sp. 179-K 8D1 HS]|uniref:nickel ABC transporter permease n=1 Tax=Siminovitchia sp. 179-K 8D1 HS TaxID=3142385 RepID=UPI00399FF865